MTHEDALQLIIAIHQLGLTISLSLLGVSGFIFGMLLIIVGRSK